MRRILRLVCAEFWMRDIIRDFAPAGATRAFRKESHAHRGRCAGSRTARDIARPFGQKTY